MEFIDVEEKNQQKRTKNVKQEHTTKRAKTTPITKVTSKPMHTLHGNKCETYIQSSIPQNPVQ